MTRDAARAANRAAFPFAANLADQLRAAGIPCRLLYARQGDRHIGTPQPFDGTDIDSLLALADRKMRPIKVTYIRKSSRR